MTLYKLKETAAQVGAELREVSQWIVANAGDPKMAIEEVRAKKAQQDELQERVDMLKMEITRAESAEQAKAEMRQAVAADPATAKMEAKGKFYRTAFLQGPAQAVLTAKNAAQHLGAIPTGDADLGYGENLLPTNISNEILSEPLETNSLRTVEQITNITGLEIPALDFEIDDAKLEDITDKETAKEIDKKANKVVFGRFKTKIKASIGDTVIHGSTLNLAQHVDNSLRSGLAVKEKMRAFATNPDNTHQHMSFYGAENGVKIKEIERPSLLEGILAAYGDLHDMFADNATVVMRRADYVDMIQTLANKSDTLWGKKPEDVIGIPVVFNDRAVYPVVGDFHYAHLNYDIGTIFDTDKDVDAGVYKFVLTAWFDHRIKLRSAFRIVKIKPAASGGGE